MPFSGVLGWVWFGSGTSTGFSVPAEYWELIYNGIKLLHKGSIAAVTLWKVPKPYGLWSIQPQHKGTKQSPLCLFLSRFMLPVTHGFSFRKLTAIFARISVSEREQASLFGTMPNNHSADTATCSLHSAELLAILWTNPTSRKVVQNINKWSMPNDDVFTVSASNSSSTCSTGHEKRFMSKQP